MIACKICVAKNGLKGADVFSGKCKYAFETQEQLERHLKDYHKLKIQDELVEIESPKANPLFLIDNSALKDMFEGKNYGKELADKMITLNIKGVVPVASFLRAIYLAEPNTRVSEIQKTMKFLEIGYEGANYKNEKAVMDEIIEIAKEIGKKVEKGELK